MQKAIALVISPLYSCPTPGQRKESSVATSQLGTGFPSLCSEAGCLGGSLGNGWPQCPQKLASSRFWPTQYVQGFIRIRLLSIAASRKETADRLTSSPSFSFPADAYVLSY